MEFYSHKNIHRDMSARFLEILRVQDMFTAVCGNVIFIFSSFCSFFKSIILIYFKLKCILKADEHQSSTFLIVIKAVLCSTIITALPIVLSQTLHIHTVPHRFVLIPAYLRFNRSSNEWA